MSEIPMPELCETLLSPDQFQELIGDLMTHAEDVKVTVKGAARDRPAPVRIDEAGRGLADGSVRAVQVRYRFDGEAWCDTLSLGPDGTRLVRTKMLD